MRFIVLAAVLVSSLLAVACSELPPPRVVDAPGSARIAGLLKAPPLRPVPDTLVAFQPPYAFRNNAFLSLHIPSEAGVALVYGKERYGIVDTGTGDIVATGAGIPGGMLSPNGRVLVQPTGDALELRAAESGELLATLPGAKRDWLSWVEDAGMVYVVPGTGPFDEARIVYRHFPTGLESSVATVADGDDAEPRVLGVLPVPDRPGHYYLETRAKLYELTLEKREQGLAAIVVATVRDGFFKGQATEGYRVVGDLIVGIEDGTLQLLDFLTLARTEVPLPGFVATGSSRVNDIDRVLVSGHFVDGDGDSLKVDGRVPVQRFYYRLSNGHLAALPAESDPPFYSAAHETGYLTRDGITLRPYELPPAGAEGEIADVLAAARAEVVASAEPSA